MRGDLDHTPGLEVDDAEPRFTVIVEFEAGDRAALDLKYMDFFGVNACCAPDGWMKKVE